MEIEVQPELHSLFSNRDFGRYADEKGEMNVCFISYNDITGGNSGSAMFNAKGELLGLPVDGNWEAMGSDILYEPKMQRCIGGDVRYILFMIERYGKAGNLIRELKIASGRLTGYIIPLIRSSKADNAALAPSPIAMTICL